MRKQRFTCKNGDYYVDVAEDDNGVVTARDYFCDMDGLESGVYGSWEDAVKKAEECIQSNEGFYAKDVPVTPLVADDGDVCKYDVTDLKEDAAEKLKELLASGEDFDTGFGASTKEIQSVRFFARDDTITVSVHAEMDDIPELFLDAVPNELAEKLGENFLDEIESEYEVGLGMDCAIVSEATVEESLSRNASYEEVMNAVSRALHDAEEELDSNYGAAKGVVKEYLIEHNLWDERFAADFESLD